MRQDEETAPRGALPATALWVVWTLLLVLALAGYLLGVSGQARLALVLPSLAIVLIKGQLLIDHFMEARYAHPGWRLLLSGYLWTVTAVIGLTFLMI